MHTKYPRMVDHQQRALAIVRIAVGLLFLSALLAKLNPDFVPTFYKALQPFIKSTPYAFYKDFLAQTVVPAHMAFAYLVLIVELVVGVGLVLGLFTAPLALLGAVLALNYYFAAAGLGFATGALALLLVVVLVALALGYAGTTWGVDRHLVGRTPYWFQGLIHYEYREF
ncbi:hypothetical protein D3C72_623660 [compost metagenome]